MFDVGVTEKINTGENRAQITGRPCQIMLAFISGIIDVNQHKFYNKAFISGIIDVKAI